MLTPRYDIPLVAMSIVIAVFASYVALDLVGRLSTPQRRARLAWWLGGSVAMGIGIWSMHFIGMLAFRLPVPVSYDIWLVTLSVVVAISASALALFVASRPALPLRILIISTLLMGAAISGMHYIGMAAMIVPVVVTWHPVLVVASVVIAVSASFVGLLLAFRLRRSSGGMFHSAKLWAAATMGAAIAGMHYTAMAAARFGPGSVEVFESPSTLHLEGLSVAVIASTALILGLALASAVIDERSRLLDRERRARADAEEANRLKDEFLATLSHELRTPLNVILGRTQMLLATPTKDNRLRQAVETIERNGAALARLVDDLLDVSRIAAGQLNLELRTVQLGAVVEAAVASVEPAAHAKGIRLTVRADPQPAFIEGDPSRLQQIVWNLLINAVKFTGNGGAVTVTLTSEDRHVLLSVADTGQGIDPGFLPYVFDTFRQAQPANTRTHGGLGLGLAIVRRLTELHGGIVAAQSAGLGRGAIFTVRLPRPTGSVELRATETDRRHAL